MTQTRRDFIAISALGALGSALPADALQATASQTDQQINQQTPGAPPAFGTSAPVGPEVSAGTFAEAEKLYAAALDTGDAARAAVADDAYLFAFETNLIRFYDEMIDMLLSRGRVRDALLVAERSRAVTLLEGKGVLKRGSGTTAMSVAVTIHIHECSGASQ